MTCPATNLEGKRKLHIAGNLHDGKQNGAQTSRLQRTTDMQLAHLQADLPCIQMLFQTGKDFRRDLDYPEQQR